MIIFFYSFVPLLFLPTDSSSIRDRNFRNDLVPLFGSRLDSSKKDDNSLKIVSNEPFIIQLQMPNSGESTRKGGKEKDSKRKRPLKKRVPKLKQLRKRHRQRRDLQIPKIDLDKERKSDRLEMPQTGKVIEHQSENATKNAISRADILKALSSYTKKREEKKGNKDVNNFQQDEERGTEMAKYVSNKTPDVDIQRLSSPPLVKMVYPSAPKTDKHLHKYSYKDLMSDRERLEKKIKYIRNMMNLSTADDAVRVRRRSESDRTANKIAKMFLTLSAVNGLHDRLKSKCDDDDNDNDEDSYSFWEKESQENPSRRSSSSNEERYKVKKWIEHMKNKRSSSKTCPCMAKEHDEESDVFPLEQKLPKNYYLLQKGGGSEESSETYGDPSSFHRDKPIRNNHNKKRNHKAREEQENKLKALAGKGRKLDLPLDDLDVYRIKAKQILQNAEEILDKIKEEEERRLSTPNILMNQLKELTSRIQTDPRNNENDLIRKIQKTLGFGPTSKSSDGAGGNGFLENVKSFILDPYEKAKALTDESTKKLSTYLLRNLGELQETGEIKEDGDDKGVSEVHFGQVPQKEVEEPYPVSLAKENTPDDNQTKAKERPQNWTDTVSSILAGRNENKKAEDSRSDPEGQFKKRMEEIMKEQEKKLNGYEATQESEESSKELDRIGNRKEEQGENEIVEQVNLKEDEISMPLQQKKDEENHKTEKMDSSESALGSTSRESDSVSEKEVSEGAEENETTSALKNKEVEREVLKELLKEFDKSEESVESEVASAYKELSSKEGDEERSSANEESPPVESVHEKSNDQDEISEAVAAATPKEKETGLRNGSDVDPKSGSDYDDLVTGGSDEISPYGTDERIEAKKPEQLKEDKSDEEPVLEEQKEPETEPNPEINSADDLVKTPGLSTDSKETVGIDDPALKSADELQKETDQVASTQTEIESQAAVEYPDSLKEAKPDESLEKMNSNGEKDEAASEKSEKEDTLQLEIPAEVHIKDDSANENAYDHTLGDHQLPKVVVDNEDQESLSGATLDVENSNEGFDESKKEVSGHQEENYTDELPLGSAASKELIKETSSSPHSGGDGDEASQRIEKPAEEASAANESEISLKEANGKAEETSYSSEDTTPLKLTMNNKSGEEDENVNVDDKILGMTATSEEEVNEKLGKSEGNDEALLKSALNKSQDPDKYAEEISRMAADSSQVGNDEGGETQIADEETDDKLKLSKPNFGVNDDLGTVKEKDGIEVVSEEKEESFGKGEEIRLEATGPSGEIDRETQNPDNDDINDSVQKERNSDEKSGTEREDKDTLSKAPDLEILKEEREVPSEKPEGMNIQDEKNMNRDATTDETLKATLEEKDRENFDQGDEGEGFRQSEESDEKLKAVDKTKEREAVLDDRTLENEDTDEEISLKATNNEEDVGGLNENKDDDETPLQAPLDDKDQETTRQIDDETILKAANVDDDARDEDENNDDDNLMINLGKDDQLPPKETDETLSKAISTDEAVNKEAEENRDKNEGISDDIPLKIAVNKDSEESLEGVETPLKATRNKGDEETLEDIEEIPLRTVNIDDGLNDKETGHSKQGGEKAAYTDDVMEDDLTVGTDEQTFVGAKSTEEARHESSASDEENTLRGANFEGLNNNVHDIDETPLRATDDLNHKDSLKSPHKYNSEEYLREVSVPDDFNNQIDGQIEDETPLQSVRSFAGIQRESEEGGETLRKENPSEDPEETENQAVSTENESPLAAAASKQQIKSQKNPKEITSENLQELHPRRNPLKTNPLKVPTSIAKIMKDLEGQEKDDITTIENLNPEKIDYIIGKIDEVEQQNKVIDEVDCRRECACAEDINTKSRNIGRYEIVKDILQWMKDLQLNRVLSDD